MAVSQKTIYALVKTDLQNTTPNDLLRKPTNGLLGVNAAAATALKSFDVNTIFDLATSDVFEGARKIVKAGSNTKSLMYQHGNPTADIVRESVVGATKIDQIRYLSIAALERVPEASAPSIAAALDVANIRDLAEYPPSKAALHILNTAYFPENEPGFDIDQPADLLPTNGNYPTERVQYSTLVMDEIKIGTATATIDILADTFKPLDLTKLAGADAGFQNVAFGTLLTMSQSWFAQGVTLGNLLHSVSLAPGESTRMAVIDWTRKSSAGQADTIVEADELSNETSHNRAMNEVTEATANDAQSGFSSIRSSSSAQQVGVAASAAASFGFGVAGVAATYSAGSNKTAADSFSTSSGYRNLGASTLQNVNDRTHQNAHSVRPKRAAVVKEVSQTEHESISTRILANYNHMHALTVQYYEVLQVYRTKASLAKVDKVVFIPVKLMDFKNDDLIRRFRAVLVAASPNASVRNQLMNLDFTEISPDPATNYTWLNGQSPTTLTALTGARLSRQAAAGTPPSSTPSLPQPTAQASPAKLPSPSEQWAELADKLWNTVQQTARISGMLSQAVLRPNSSSLFTPTDVVIEGVMMHQSEETETGQWFETIAGEQISLSQVSSGYDLAVNELKALHLTVQANEERDNIIRFQLILNRNGVRFPLELPAITWPKKFRSQVVVVNFKTAGMNAEVKNYLANSKMYYNTAVFKSLDATQVALLLSGCVVKIKQKQTSGQIIEKAVPVS